MRGARPQSRSAPAACRLVAAACAVALAGCPKPVPGPFEDVTAAVGLDFVHTAPTSTCTGEPSFLYYSGVCAFDADVDGDLDLFLVDSGGAASRLYRNDGGRFTDATAAMGIDSRGLGQGCLAFDYDADGDEDLFVTRHASGLLRGTGGNQLFRNDRGRFADVTAEAGLAFVGNSLSAAAGDLDGDGDLDLVVSQGVTTCDDVCDPSPSTCRTERSLVYENRENRFVETGAERGVTEPGEALATLLFDFDGDGDLDLYLGHDGGRHPDRLYVNDGAGRFVDRGAELGLAFDAGGKDSATMGADVGDVDGDGHLDLVSTNFSGDLTLYYRCDANRRCTDVSAERGLEASRPFLNWGVGLEDFDADGDLDLFTASGELLMPFVQRNQLFWNERGTFAEHVPGPDEPLAVERVWHGAAFGDFDGDLRVDIVVTATGAAPQLLRNQVEGGASLLVELDTLAIGASVTVTAGGRTLTRPLLAGRGYLGSSDRRLHFGLGAASTADVTVRWPGGATRTLPGVAAGQVLKVERPR